MMGERRVAQEALFYEFSLERHVPADHLLRAIDRVVDLSGLRTHLRPFYSDLGRLVSFSDATATCGAAEDRPRREPVRLWPVASAGWGSRGSGIGARRRHRHDAHARPRRARYCNLAVSIPFHGA